MVNNKSAYSRDFPPLLSYTILHKEVPAMKPRKEHRPVGDTRTMTILYQLKDQTPTEICHTAIKTKSIKKKIKPKRHLKFSII